VQVDLLFMFAHYQGRLQRERWQRPLMHTEMVIMTL
jgi:hypothetical protein